MPGEPAPTEGGDYTGMGGQDIEAASTALSLNNICKQFAGVQALNNVSFDLAAGEIHALLGENGAGKSTLIKVMTGAYARDSGTICLDGKQVSPGSPAAALALGISTVYQEVNLLPNLSVAHNLYLGREPKRCGCIHWRQLNADAATLLRRLRLDIDVTRPLSSCSLAVQQLVAIARGIDLSARILVLDEPTASLDHDEVELLFAILRGLKTQGIGIIFITHFLDQVYAIADRITVLRNGERVGTFVTADLPRTELVGHMLGRELQALEQKPPVHTVAGAGTTALEVSALSAANGLQQISFSAVKGQAIGLSGLLGSGRTELCEALFGLVQITGGRLAINGRVVTVASPRAAIGHAMAMCPEDRKAQGIIAGLSVRENIILALQAKRGWLKPLARTEQNRLADAAVSDLAIACPDAEKAVGELSGGNQQKVILARWLATEPQILILDEPTRGIDIGAHAQIIRLIRRLCGQGLVVLVASSEIEELVAVCDTVIVLRERTLETVLTADRISEQHIMTAMARAGQPAGMP